MRNYLMEFIGTMFLVLTIGLAGDPIAIGVVLMVMVYMGGHISGAHYNPAVTLAVWMRGKLNASQVPGYVVAQILGAIAAALIYYLIKGSTFSPSPGAGVLPWKATLLELLFTFALCSVVLTVATTKKLEGNYIYGLAIGFTLLTSAMSIGSISGGVLNPAVAIGPMIVKTLMDGNAFGPILIYIIGPLLGGAFAARIYLYLNPAE